MPAARSDTSSVALRGDELAALSLVVPLYNEEENVPELVARIAASLDHCGWAWEVVLVDDGSSDGTLEALLRARQRYGAHVRVIGLRRNYGQTAAMRAGI